MVVSLNLCGARLNSRWLDSRISQSNPKGDSSLRGFTTWGVSISDLMLLQEEQAGANIVSSNMDGANSGVNAMVEGVLPCLEVVQVQATSILMILLGHRPNRLHQPPFCWGLARLHGELHSAETQHVLVGACTQCWTGRSAARKQAAATLC